MRSNTARSWGWRQTHQEMTTDGTELTRRPEEGSRVFFIPGRIDNDESRSEVW